MPHCLGTLYCLAGFEKIIQRHFRLLRDTLLKQCCLWLADCGDSEEGKKLRRVVDEVRQQLEGLQEEEEKEEEEESDEEEGAGDA